MPLAGRLPDRLTAALEVEDDFLADNRLALERIEARRYRVGYVGPAEAALMHFL